MDLVHSFARSFVVHFTVASMNSSISSFVSFVMDFTANFTSSFVSSIVVEFASSFCGSCLMNFATNFALDSGSPPWTSSAASLLHCVVDFKSCVVSRFSGSFATLGRGLQAAYVAAALRASM